MRKISKLYKLVKQNNPSLETVQANLRLINPQFKPTWSQFRALAQANHRFARFRCLFFGIIRFCTYSSSEVIAKSAKKCKI